MRIQLKLREREKEKKLNSQVICKLGNASLFRINRSRISNLLRDSVQFIEVG